MSATSTPVQPPDHKPRVLRPCLLYSLFVGSNTAYRGAPLSCLLPRVREARFEWEPLGATVGVCATLLSEFLDFWPNRALGPTAHMVQPSARLET